MKRWLVSLSLALMLGLLLVGPAVKAQVSGSQFVVTSGTQTVNLPVFTATQTWNAGGVTFQGVLVNVTNTASAAASTLLDLQIAGTSQFNVSKAGAVTYLGTTQAGAVGSSYFLANGAAGAASTNNYITKVITGIADAVATPTFTVTIPNAAHSASLRVRLAGSLGAGGAIGANEAVGTNSMDFAIARTAGVATVVVASTAYGTANANVAGATTITVVPVASAVAGAVGVTQTFTVNVTITKGAGGSTNHTCFAYGELLNANATGITIS